MNSGVISQSLQVIDLIRVYEITANYRKCYDVRVSGFTRPAKKRKCNTSNLNGAIVFAYI